MENGEWRRNERGPWCKVCGMKLKTKMKRERERERRFDERKEGGSE
jgi:hypothetical protein